MDDRIRDRTMLKAQKNPRSACPGAAQRRGPAVDPDGNRRPGAEVVELTALANLAA